jgi:tryptophan synthase alpha chain
MSGGASIKSAVEKARESRGVALVAYICAGHPTKRAFRDLLREVAAEADVVEVGVPFSDPMADGVTIQEASRVALEQGVNLRWILEELAAVRGEVKAPIVLMGYLNPFVRFGIEPFALAAKDAGVAGLIIPDLPLEESGAVREALNAQGVALVNMVTPVTPPERLSELARTTGGFLYAVTTTGVTGGANASAHADPIEYLRSLRGRCDAPGAPGAPVCAGFGIRSKAQVDALRGVCDGAIVGSALIESIDRGESAARFLASLRA